jgi:hypothetical protein
MTKYGTYGCCDDTQDHPVYTPRLPPVRGRLAGRFSLETIEVSILSDAGLYERYKHSIPVVAIVGGPTLAAPIREAELIRWLE